MLTLQNQKGVSNDMLIKGIIDSVVTVNQFYAMLPFAGIHGNALAYNREMAGNDQMDLVSVLNTGHTSIDKGQQLFSRESTELTTIVGDAQVNGLIQAVGSDFNDATAVQVAAKAKGIGRKYMDLMINGNFLPTFTDATLWSDVDGYVQSVFNAQYSEVDTLTERQAITDLTVYGVTLASALTEGTGAAENLTTAGVTFLTAVALAALTLDGYAGFNGLKSLVNSEQEIGIHTGSDKEVLNYLDSLIDRVHDKDGMVDYIMCNSAVVRAITASFRLNGTGFDMMDVKNSSGAVMAIQSYRGVPIFRNDFIDPATSAGNGLAGFGGGDAGVLGSAAAGDIFIGTLDDGSFSHGICGLTASKSAGMQVQKLGARENVDADITRVKWYCGLAHFSELGLVKGSI